jgi:putative endonuclease
MNAARNGRPLDSPGQAAGSSGRTASAIRGTVRWSRQQAGRAAEDAAAAWLTRHGARILLRNYRRRTGELDIVALGDGVLVIAEVRMRASDAYGGAAASVDARKQRRLVRTAQQLLQQYREYARLPVRFDVLVVSASAHPATGESRAPAVEWIQHAFQA